MSKAAKARSIAWSVTDEDMKKIIEDVIYGKEENKKNVLTEDEIKSVIYAVKSVLIDIKCNHHRYDQMEKVQKDVTTLENVLKKLENVDTAQ